MNLSCLSQSSFNRLDDSPDFQVVLKSFHTQPVRQPHVIDLNGAISGDYHVVLVRITEQRWGSHTLQVRCEPAVLPAIELVVPL